jgi:molybdopterin-containing oxidoreductase family iron-sulfur binding subunit
VCPTGATYKRKDGTVVINNNICIGCRICMAACPYETRFFWWNEPVEESPPEHESSPEYDVHHFKGTVSKCDLCVDKAYKGQLPDCVNACPRGVLYYGDLNEDIVSNKFESLKLSETLEKHGGYRYKEEEGTHPSVYYLPPAGQKDIREKGKKGIF